MLNTKRKLSETSCRVASVYRSIRHSDHGGRIVSEIAVLCLTRATRAELKEDHKWPKNFNSE